MTKLPKGLETLLKENDFTITYGDGDITFGKYSPEGQDFSFTVDFDGNLSELADNVCCYYEGYDPQEEASYWSKDGHGINGAPYDLIDLVHDMEACEEYIREVYNIINDYDGTIYEDDDITVKFTGNDYDFVATIENNNKQESVVILFDDSTGLEPRIVEAGDWVGLLAEDTSEQIIEAFLQEKFETHYKKEMDRLNLWFLV